MTSDLVRGEVVEFDTDAGLGTLRADDGRSFRFHCTAIADGTRRIPVGVRVHFTVAAGQLGEWEAAVVDRD